MTWLVYDPSTAMGSDEASYLAGVDGKRLSRPNHYPIVDARR